MDSSDSSAAEPTHVRPQHVPCANVAFVCQSTPAPTAGPCRTTDTAPTSGIDRRTSLMAGLPVYSDGLPYPEPKVVRRPVSRAVGWLASNLRRDSRRVRDSERSKTLPSAREQRSENLLNRLFKRNWSDNAALQGHESGRTLNSVPSSLSSSLSHPAPTFSNAVDPLVSVSSACDEEHCHSPTGPPHPLVGALLEPSSTSKPSLQLGTQSCSDVQPTEPSLAAPEPLVEFTQDNELSRYGSCRDVVQEDNNDSGLASDVDTQRFPGPTSDAGLHLVDASPLDAGVVPLGGPTVNQFHCSSDTLQGLASRGGKSPSPAHKGLQRRHTSDPTNTMAVGLHLPQGHKEHANQLVKKGATRPLSLCVPVEHPLFGDKGSQGNFKDDSCELPLDPPGKGRLLAAVSTMDIRTPPTSIKVVRSSASYVDVHEISKMDTEDDEYRQLVVKWILDTERSYLQALQTVVQVYMEPLQRHQRGVLEAEAISDIFYQVPEICNLHKSFVSQLCERRDSWKKLDTIGDLFVSHFSASSVVDMYSKFTSNFMNAKLTIQQMRKQRPSFARFLEQCARDNREKLNLGDLLIKPIQRIPRYVLFIRDLLKHTVHSHPDHSQLELALEQLTALAEQMNEAEKEASKIDKLRDLAVNIEGATGLLAPRRWLLRHDFVMELRGTQQKKDRCIFLFNDLVLFAAMRRRSSFRRSMLSVQQSRIPDFSGMRYKFLWQAPISVCNLSQVQPSPGPRRIRSGSSMVPQMDQLQQDLATLAKIEELSQQLRVERQGLDSVIRETLSKVARKMDEFKDSADQAVFNLETARLNLLVFSSRPPSPYSMVFIDSATKEKWKADFLEAKKAAEVDLKSRRAASMRLSSARLTLHNLEFLHSLDLQPGRVGMKVTCAGAGLPIVQGSNRSLWVCRGDKYGGQVCLLDVEGMDKPNLVSSITVCNSEIRCIAMVPYGLHGHLSNSNDTPHSQGRLSHTLGMHDEALHAVAQNRTEDGREQSKAGRKGSEAGGEGPEAGREGSEAGGEGSEAGGEGSEAGGEGSEAGGEGSEAGGEGSEAGGEGSEVGVEGSEAGGEGSDAGGGGSEAGGEGSEAGGERSDAGGERSEAGGEGSEAGGEGSEAGGEGSEVGGEGSEAGGEGSEAIGERSEAGGEGSKVGVEGSEAGGEGSDAGGEGSEAGGEGSEAGGERSEAGGEESEAGGEGSEVGVEGSEAGGEGSEAGGERSEAGGEGSEAGGERSEAGGEESEAGGERSDTGGEWSETEEKVLNVREHWPKTIGEGSEVCECCQEAVGEGQDVDEGVEDRGEQWLDNRREGPEKEEQWLEAGEEGAGVGKQRPEVRGEGIKFELQWYEAGQDGLEAEQEEPEVGKEAPDAGGEGPVIGRDRIEVGEHWLEAGQEIPKPGVEEGPGTEGEGPEFEGQRLEATSEGEEPLFGLEYSVAGVVVEDQEQEAAKEAPQAVGDRQEFGGEEMEVEEHWLEAGGERPSPLAFQELNKSEGQLSASGSMCTGAQKGHRGLEAKESSVSHQRQLKAIPLHLERNDSDPEGDGGNACRSPCEDTCVTAHTLDSARYHAIPSRDSWDVSHGAYSVQPGTEHISVRGRSYSAPPDPLEVIKTRLKNKSVTICESSDEISVQMQQPRQMSSVSTHSYNHLAETDPQPISPLTLKPVEHSAEVWLGTGEGSVYVFRVGDNLRSRNKCVVPLYSSVCCVKYFDSCMYVGLENGSLAVFEMDEDGAWQLDAPHVLSLGSEAVLCCEPVLGDMWIGSGNKVILLDTHSLSFQVLFSLPSSCSNPIATIVCIDQGVWLFTTNSTHIHLYHATSSKHLATVDVSGSVSNVLSNLNPILCQHKLSCLRISSLAHVKSSLLIGTSAGVILLLPLPAIGTTSTVTGSLAPLALMEGHAGPISFVAAMALKGNRPDMVYSASKSESETDMLVFSGGDGLEDFLSTGPPAAITDCSSCVNVWRC